MKVQVVCPALGKIIAVCGVKRTFASCKGFQMYDGIVFIDFFRQIVQFIKSTEIPGAVIHGAVSVPLFFREPLVAAASVLSEIFPSFLLAPETLEIVAVQPGTDEPVTTDFPADVQSLNVAAFPLGTSAV